MSKETTKNLDKFTWNPGDINIIPAEVKPEINHDKFSWKIGDLVVHPEATTAAPKVNPDKFVWNHGDIIVHGKDDK
jgi:hypothetical protein